jgi:hypothetical protein
METIGYERSFLVFNQSGIIALQDGLVTDFSYGNIGLGHERGVNVVDQWPRTP